MNCEDRLFVYDKKSWEKRCRPDLSLADPPFLKEIENGIILPLRKRKDIYALEAAYEGGVCDSDGNFVAGIYRNLNNLSTNRSCAKAYKVSGDIAVRHETVIFGGVFYGAFPESMFESTGRLWYYADHPDTPYKLVFLHAHTFSDYVPYDMLELAGITKDRMEILDAPTRFDKIIVPQETIYLVTNYRNENRKFYGFLRSRVAPGPHKKIYLSREKLRKNELQDVINEGYFSEFYRKRGYEIIYPEQLPFKEQISILSGADEIVATQGTLTAMAAIYSKPGTRLVCLNRGKGLVNIFTLLQCGEVDYYIIDTYFGFLPATTNSVYFLGPTLHWKEYLDKQGIAYEPDELSFDIHVRPYFYDYVDRWADWYLKNPKAYYRIHNYTVVDVLEEIGSIFSKNMDRSKYTDRDDITKLKAENAALKNKVDALETVIKSSLKELSKERPDALLAAARVVGVDDASSGGKIQAGLIKMAEFEGDGNSIVGDSPAPGGESSILKKIKRKLLRK